MVEPGTEASQYPHQMLHLPPGTEDDETDKHGAHHKSKEKFDGERQRAPVDRIADVLGDGVGHDGHKAPIVDAQRRDIGRAPVSAHGEPDETRRPVTEHRPVPFKGIAVQHYGVGFKRFQPVFTAADDVRRVARGRDRLAAGRQDIAVAALVEVAHIHDPGEDGHIIHAGYRADDLPVPDDGRIKEQIVRAMPVTDETHVVIAAQHNLSGSSSLNRQFMRTFFLGSPDV